MTGKTEITRRDGLKAAFGSLVAMGIIDSVPKASAASVDNPRITLGDDYEIDDGDSGLQITHKPSGSTLQYDESLGKWVVGDINAQTVSATEADVGTVNTDELDITGSRFASNGDFIAVGPQGNWAIKTFSTTSTSYTSNIGQFLLRVKWDEWVPDNAQGAVKSVLRLQDTNGDVRVVDSSQGVTILEQLDVSTNAWVRLGPTNYTPPDTSAPSEIKVEIRTNDGATQTSLLWPRVDLGIQL